MTETKNIDDFWIEVKAFIISQGWTCTIDYRMPYGEYVVEINNSISISLRSLYIIHDKDYKSYINHLMNNNRSGYISNEYNEDTEKLDMCSKYLY